MKKIVMILALVMLVQGVASAETDRERLIAYKKQQRELKEREKANPSPKAKGFWAREASRSGLAGTGAMLTGAVSSVVPLDKPNSRKKD